MNAFGHTIDGEELRVDPATFNNDMTSVASHDDALSPRVSIDVPSS